MSEQLPIDTEQLEGKQDELIEAVEAELAKKKAKQRSPWNNLWGLALSLIVFAALGLFEATLQGIVIVIGVLFFHELGHLAGMKLFGYRDVRMFFIPLFGTAVSGKARRESGARQGLVSLMGPVPGIIAGFVVGVVHLGTGGELSAQIARTALIINAFNLLPFLPLDGGRLLEAVLFGRRPRVEAGFKVFAACGLGLLALGLGSIVLGVLAGFELFGVSTVLLHGRAVRRLREEFAEGAESDEVEEVPRPQLAVIVNVLAEKLGKGKNPAAAIAPHIEIIWRRFVQRHPRVLASGALVAAYALALILGIATPLLFEMAAQFRSMRTEISERVLDDGQTVEIQQIFVGDTVICEHQLDGERLYHGPCTFWRFDGEVVECEGNWTGGFRDGQWRFYDFDGQLDYVVEYDQGQAVRCLKVGEDGGLVEEPESQWGAYEIESG